MEVSVGPLWLHNDVISEDGENYMEDSSWTRSLSNKLAIDVKQNLPVLQSTLVAQSQSSWLPLRPSTIYNSSHIEQ